MCGRYALFATKEELSSHFNLQVSLVMQPRFNIAPTQTVPIIFGALRKIEFASWGFVPHWVKPDLSEKQPSGIINARAETLFTKPSFKAAIAKNRCLIPASGFFEWRTIHNKKQPFFVKHSQAPIFAMAGFYAVWENKLRVAIITTQANQDLKNLHDRMPLIINSENYNKWLATQFTQEDLDALNQQAMLGFEFYPVTMQMNNPKFDASMCVKRL